MISEVDIAIVCHEVNRVISTSNGEADIGSWKDISEEMRESIIDGVLFYMSNPDATPSEFHDNWMIFKIQNGWKYGPEKDFEKKTHPCLVPYEDLPENQKIKDKIFKVIVDHLSDCLPEANSVNV